MPLAKEADLPTEHDKLLACGTNRFAVVAPEVCGRLEVGGKFAGQPHAARKGQAGGDVAKLAKRSLPRQTFATAVLLDGARLRAVSLKLGHKPHGAGERSVQVKTGRRSQIIVKHGTSDQEPRLVRA